MKGFTLVEILIVLAITAMLTGIAMTYTSIGRNETALSVESAKEAGFIINAKNLSLAMYYKQPPNPTVKICAYGVLFNVPSNTYSLFAYAPFAPTTTLAVNLHCPDTGPGTDTVWYAGSPPMDYFGSITAAEAPYQEVPVSSSTWNVPVSNGVKLVSGGNNDDLKFVFFYPPDLTVFMSNDGVNFVSSTSRVYLSTVDNSASNTITVNGVGQVNF